MRRERRRHERLLHQRLGRFRPSSADALRAARAIQRTLRGEALRVQPARFLVRRAKLRALPVEQPAEGHREQARLLEADSVLGESQKHSN